MSAASHGPPHRISRALGSLAALVALFVAVPVALAAASRSRFDAANPLVGIDPPWRWEPAALGDAVAEPLRDDAVVNLLIRTSLTVIWLALAVVAVTIVVEVVHMVRHRGLAAPHVRGFGWAQGIGRWVAVGLIALVPINSFASTAQAVAGAATPAATAQRFGPTPEPASQVAGEVVSSFAPDEIADLPRPDAEAPESSTTAAGVEAPASSAVHVVARGESIYAIAADYAAGPGAA